MTVGEFYNTIAHYVISFINRDFIGIELDEKYFNIAKERIDKSTES